MSVRTNCAENSEGGEQMRNRRIPAAERPARSTLLRRCLPLLLALLIPAAATADAQTFSTEAYTVEIPAGWQMDVTELLAGEDYRDLGYFWSEGPSGGLVLEAGLFDYPALKGVSLTTGDNSFVDNWSKAMLEDFAESRPQVREFIATDELVFIVLDIEDELEPLCYAETLLDGTVYSFRFYAYRMMREDGSVPDAALTDAEYAVFREILLSFTVRH